VQNLTEALLAVQVMPAGVYVAMHNRVLAFPGVRKDVSSGTFVKDPARDGKAHETSPAPSATIGAR
jgi:hypothetical protein